MEKEIKKSLLNTKATARRLGVCYRTMQKLIYERKIGFIKVGGDYKFREEDIEKFFEKNYIKPIN